MSRRTSRSRRTSHFGKGFSQKIEDYLGIIYGQAINDASHGRRKGPHYKEDHTKSQPVGVDYVDLRPKEVSKDHHTDNYEILKDKDPVAIFRRGETFFMTIEFKRPVELNKDNITLIFVFGPKQQVGKGTMVILPITESPEFTKDKEMWDVCLTKQEKTALDLKIRVPAMVPVGIWFLKIETHVEGNKKCKMYEHSESIYILFNPWCEDDLVFMKDEEQREEYVLNEVGKIFVGTPGYPRGKIWFYGQFQSVSLPTSVFILERSGLEHSARGNPIKVVRAISAMVNNNDNDFGIVMGAWRSDYSGGQNPSSWTGSTAILDQYLETAQPVAYGQCWVYSGVCTTVCRALGIPCRSVTNFNSAHDSDDTMSIDWYHDEKGKLEKGSETTWNYHVWNDCWMARPDLPAGYGGWQAVDGTPQEMSGGRYRSGPTSVIAVKKGDVSYLYDGPFVFAEVNADIIYWQKTGRSRGEYRKLRHDPLYVGKLLLTKKIGDIDEIGLKDMEDITEEYKEIEGTAEERMGILNAARQMQVTHIYDIPKPEEEDIEFKLRELETVTIGQPFQIVVDLQSKSKEMRTVHCTLAANSIHYNGIFAYAVASANNTYTLAPEQKQTLGIEVSVNEYYDKLVDYSYLKMFASAMVEETRQTWADSDNFQVVKPSLTIETDGTLKVNQHHKIQLWFKNPLKWTLRHCTISIEGPGVVEPQKLVVDDIPPEGTMTHTQGIEPWMSGKRIITAVFNSRHLMEVMGSKKFNIEE